MSYCALETTVLLGVGNHCYSVRLKPLFYWVLEITVLV